MLHSHPQHRNFREALHLQSCIESDGEGQEKILSILDLWDWNFTYWRHTLPLTLTTMKAVEGRGHLACARVPSFFIFRSDSAHEWESLYSPSLTCPSSHRTHSNVRTITHSQVIGWLLPNHASSVGKHRGERACLDFSVRCRVCLPHHSAISMLCS